MTSKLKLGILIFAGILSNSFAEELKPSSKKQSNTLYSLLDVYKLAYKNNAQFQADVANFKSQKENVPISLGALLPSVSVSYSATENYSNPKVFSTETTFPTYGPELTASQVLFDWSSWKTYTAAQYTMKANAIVLAQKQQQLISDTVQDYLSVLNNQELVKVSRASQKWNKNLYDQAQQKYEVGVIPVSDVQSAKANYEQANAQLIQDNNQLLTSIYNLKQLTGVTIQKVDDLKADFPFTPPSPNSVEKWLDIAMADNLSIVQNQFLVQAADDNIGVAWGNFFPSLAATGTLSKTTSFQNDGSSIQPTTGSVGIQASWNILSGGSDYATLKQKQYSLDNASFNLEQSQRTTEASLKQAFLNVESDISIITAFEQAVIAGKYSVDTMQAQYEVGTSTIVDLLNQQQQYVQSQQQLANAKYQYINDLIALKLQAGTLSMKDVESINIWLANTNTTEQSTNNKSKQITTASNAN
jgi:outer membrane protein